MSLKGNLQSVDLANVLQMLSINQKEGTLVLFDGDTRKSIYFSRDGVSMLSRGRRGQDSIGRILLRYGKITQEQLQSALEKQKIEGKRLGEALQDMGAAQPEDVENAVRTQIEEEIYNLFIWKEASFEFIEGPPPPSMENAPTRVTFNVNSLIMEAQRRADEWNYIRNLVPSLDEIYRPTEKMAEAVVTDDVFHFPFAPRVLEALQQGRQNINEIIDGSHAAKFEACKILAILLEQGAIEPVTISDLQSFAQEASSRGDHKQAAKFLSRIVDLGGATPSVNMSLGYALEALDEPERASVYLKAAAASYVEAMEPKHAFDALKRVARVLPTDLPAVTEMVEIACNDSDLLAANRHDVVEAGRTLAQCLKELGRLPAALQILNKLAQSSPSDLPLRNMLVLAFQDSGMLPEAMSELETIATACAAQKNYDEAIRCMRKVAAIDRNRTGVMKRIESYTRARDAGKRLLMRVVAVAVVLGSVGAAAWGFLLYRDKTKELLRQVDVRDTELVGPHRKVFSEKEAGFKEALHRVEDWRSGSAATVQEDALALQEGLKAMDEAIAAIEHAAGQLWDEYEKRGVLSENYVQDSARPQRRVRDIDKAAMADVFGKIESSEKAAFEKAVEEAEKDPISKIKDVKRILALLQAVKAPTTVLIGTRQQDVQRFLTTLEGYETELRKVGEKADRLWRERRYEESHTELCEWLGKLFTVEEFARTLKFHVWVTTIPDKATLSTKAGEVPAPNELPYTAADGLTFRVSAPGFEPRDVTIEGVRGVFDADTLRRKLPFLMGVVLRKMPQWTASVGAGGVDAAPVPTADGASLLVLDREGGVHRLSAADGSEAATWDARSPSGFLAGPAVAADMVYVASADGVVAALRLPGLEQVWRKEPADGPGPVYGAPVLVGDLLVVAGQGGTVAAYDAKSGALRWEQKLESGTRQPLQFARDWIVVACEDGRVRVLSRDGNEKIDVLPSSREDSFYPPVRARPLIAGDKVVLGLEGPGQEFSLVELPVRGAASPHIGYRWGVKEEGAEPCGAASSGDEVLLLFSNGSLRRVPLRRGPGAGDRPQRALPAGERPVGSPVPGDGETLLIASEKGLTCVRPAPDGYVEVWRWTAPEGATLTTGPVVVGKIVVVCSRDGKVHALLKD